MKSLEIAKEIGDKAAESRCYTGLGNVYSSLGDFKKAINYYEISLKIAKEIGDKAAESRGDKAAESRCYTGLGNVYSSLGDFKKAINYYEISLKIAKEIGDKAVESACYTGLGNMYHDLGDFRKAIEYHEKSLEIAKEIENRVGESACYINLGNACGNLGNFEKAIEYYEKSLEITEEIENKVEKLNCYANIGSIYRDLGNFEKAIEYLEKSLEIAEEIGDKVRELNCYTNLGNTHATLGDSKKAINYYEKSLEIAKKVGDRVEQKAVAACYIGLGTVYLTLGDFRKAIEYHEKSLEIAEEIGDKVGESACYVGLGNACRRIGNFKKAIGYYEISLKIAKEIGDKAAESRCYTNLGSAYYDLENSKKATDFFEKSLNILKKIGDKAAESKCYTNLGNVYNALGDFKKAIEYHKRSLKILGEIGDKIEESRCYTNLGSVYNNLGDFRKAIEYHEKSLEIAKETSDMDLKRIIYLNLGKSYHKSNPELAYDYCRQTIELSEMISGRLIEEEHKIGFHTRVFDAYRYIVPICLDIKREKEAFEYTEKGKSRAFLDLLAATHIKPFVKPTDELNSLLRDEEIYLARLRDIQRQYLRQTRAVESGEVEKIYENLAQIYDKMVEIDPEYVFTRRAKSFSLNEIQRMLSSQKRNVVLIEYFITKDETFIFVVSSKDNELHIKTVPVSVEKLIQYFENYRREVVNYSYFQDIGDTWPEFSDFLVEPVSGYLTENDLIYFVPYGPFHYLPLHALELEGEPLIKKHPVAYIPSASLIKFCQSKGSGTLESCGSFGVVFEEEAEKVAQLFNTEAYLGSLATKDNVLENCGKDIIHFSCHGYFNNLDPLSSGVMLHDAVLTAKEIFDLRLITELVTLSACQTGINQANPGDELVGLTRAFLYAGAPSVVVSLWSVDARSTHELMLEFYKQLKEGADKATALQKAQIKIMEKKEYTHPYYWAPFVLVGDWQ